MGQYRIGRTSRSLSWTVGATLIALATQASADKVGTKCDYGLDPGEPKVFADLDTTKFGECVERRTGDQGGAFTLTDKSEFATHCPVRISFTSGHKSECVDVPSALKLGDAMRINEWPGGMLELSLMRNGVPVFPGQPLRPLEVTLKNDKAPRTIGYYADVRLPPDPDHTNQPLDVRYIIALSHMKQGGKPIKFYTVEVFERRAECQAEEPSSEISTVAASCNDVAYELPTRDDGEMPSGGGGEPPRKP